MTKRLCTSVAAAAMFMVGRAHAQAPAPTTGVTQTVSPGGPMAAPVPPAPPYSIPWQLRPAAIGNVVRSDTSVAFYDITNATTGAKSSGSTVASTLLATYKITPSLAPLARVAVVQNSEPGPALGSGTAFVNPIVGLLYGHKVGDFRGTAFIGTSLPIGMGGGKAPGMDETAAARMRGVNARSAMDNAMFAVNYMTPLVGADVAYVAHKLTVQAEVTLLQLFRVRNADVDKDSKRTNFTAGLHVGYFLLPMLSFGAEARWQQWLDNDSVPKTSPARNTLTAAVGPRAHFKLGGSWFRPGISYAQGIDKPVKDNHYRIVQVDLPFVF